MKSLVAALVGLALAFGVPSASHAETQKATDATADVYEQFSTAPAPANSMTDVKSAKVNYGNKLTVEMLVPGMDLSVETRVLVVVKRSDGKEFFLSIMRFPNGSSDVTFGKVLGGPFPCNGLDYEFDEDANTVRTVIPPRCFGSPGSIKVGGLYASVIDTLTYVDDMRKDGVPNGAYSFGRVLHRN